MILYNLTMNNSSQKSIYSKTFQKNIVKKALALFVAMTMLFACLAAFACTPQLQQADTRLTLENYRTYLNIWSTGTGGVRDENSALIITSVRINKKDGVELSDVHITYNFKANEASETFSRALGRLDHTHNQGISIRVAGDFWQSGMFWLSDINISIEVVSISGTIISTPSSTGGRNRVASIVTATVFLSIAIFLLIYFIARASRFSEKVKSIKSGMTYAAVIELLGEPGSSTEAQGIRTCMWSKSVMRGLYNNHIITFKDDMVVSIGGGSTYGIK